MYKIQPRGNVPLFISQAHLVFISLPEALQAKTSVLLPICFKLGHGFLLQSNPKFYETTNYATSVNHN